MIRNLLASRLATERTRSRKRQTHRRLFVEPLEERRMLAIDLVSAAAVDSSGNGPSESPRMSEDGVFVVFESEATDLVPGQVDTNGDKDVFLLDRQTGTISLISHTGDGVTTGDAESFAPVISADGSTIAFESFATDLVAGFSDKNGTSTDIFASSGGTVTLISHAGDGVTTGNFESRDPVISADGSTIAFESFATDLVPGFINNNFFSSDVFASSGGTVTLISHTGDGVTGGDESSNAPVISADGSTIAFESFATNLVMGFRDSAISNDVFASSGGAVTLISHTGDGGTPGNFESRDPVISADGSTIAFQSRATDLVAGFSDNNGTSTDVFASSGGTVTLISHIGDGVTTGNFDSRDPVISADGSTIAFESFATDLVAGFSDNNGTSTDVFASSGGTVTLISHTGDGVTTGNFESRDPVISADGSTIAFESRATDLVAGFSDNNFSSTDVFASSGGTVTLISHTGDGVTTGNFDSRDPVISADGSTISFESRATDLVAGLSDNNVGVDVFVADSDAPSATELIGSSEAFSIVQPSLALNYIIAIVGDEPAEGTGPAPNRSTSAPMIGEIRMFGGDSPPNGWALLDGQLLSVNANQTLFSLLGTTYGGDGNTTFAIPDLRGRIPIGAGTGPGLATHALGQESGAEMATLSADQLPVHHHTIIGSGTTTSVTGDVVQPYSNLQPSLALNYIILRDEQDLSPQDPGVGEGEIVLFAGDIAPSGWEFAHGQLLDIASNIPLFAKIGTTYGGDGRTTFGLPDLRGRTAIGDGNGPGLSQRQLGDQTGEITRTVNNIVAHQHTEPLTDTAGGDVVTQNLQRSLAVNYTTFIDANASGTGRLLGEVRMYAGNLNRPDIISLDGQLLSTTTHSELFDVFENTFGGLVGNTFGLPDLRGRAAMHAGSGPGLSPRGLGEKVGTEQTTLTPDNLPSHLHTLGSIARQDPTEASTDASSLVFRVEFTERVRNVDAADFAVNGATTATVTGVAEVDPSTYDVTVSGGNLASFAGTVGLDFAAGQNITDLIGNDYPGGEPPIDETYSHIADVIAPQFTSPNSFNNPENNAPVGLVTTDDSTASLGLSGTDAALFSLADNGDGTAALAFLASPDFEAPADNDGNNRYDVTVIATDPAGNVTQQTITVDVTDVDEVGPTVTDVVDVNPDPRNTSVDQVDVQLSEQVDLATFDFADISLSNSGVPILLDASVVVSMIGAASYRVSGLGPFTTDDGEYEISVSATGIQDLAGNNGSNSATDTWVMDTTAPASQVNPLAQRQSSKTFPVTVTGDDPLSAGVNSGVESFEIYRSVEGGPWQLWTQVSAVNPTAQYTAESNQSIGFYSVAIDAAGNRESKSPQIEASTYVPDVDAPATQVDSVNTDDATFEIDFSGTDAGGSGLAIFDVFVSIDDGAPLSISQVGAGSPDGTGTYQGSTVYQAIADGTQHSYRFFTVGTDGVRNVEAAPADPSDVKLQATFQASASLEVTNFDVQQGATQRSFVRYLGVTFNSTDFADLIDSVNDADAANDRIKLLRFDLDGSGTGEQVDLAGKVAADGQTMTFDFDAHGIGGNRNSTNGDGYYRLLLDLDDDGDFDDLSDADLSFYRLLGDVTGDRTVNIADIMAITRAFGTSGEQDVNGDGVVNHLDRLLAFRSRGRSLSGGLELDD